MKGAENLWDELPRQFQGQLYTEQWVTFKVDSGLSVGMSGLESLKWRAKVWQPGLRNLCLVYLRDLDNRKALLIAFQLTILLRNHVSVGKDQQGSKQGIGKLVKGSF